MTDKDIIKALESEIHLAEYVDSDYCSNVNLEIIKSALDLINRQQTEIERLKIENQSLRGAANSYKLHYNEARAEAVKELIERLTKEYAHCTLDFTTTIDIFFCSVKRIVKEMIGED